VAKKHIVWNKQLLGQVPDSTLALQLGVSVQAVYAARARRGIPTHRGRKADRELARRLYEALPIIRVDVIPLQHFVLMLLIGTSRMSYQEIRKHLGMTQTTVSELVSSMVQANRAAIHRTKNHRGPRAIVSLTPRALREMSRRRKKFQQPLEKPNPQVL